jgi:hypothetical protein
MEDSGENSAFVKRWLANNPPSLMLRRFLEDDPSKDIPLLRTTPSDRPTSSITPDDGWPRPHFRNQYCFFYGTLMDPATLTRILQLPESEPPKVRPARVIGFETKLWGPYPALVDGCPLHPVDGLAYQLQVEEHMERLITYETNKYYLRHCQIDLLDGVDGVETVMGLTFQWDGEDKELRDGKFDLEEWLREKKLRGL